mmetsp:Transcript_9836/g.12178  ORF Transcript_9836/g.12178 Transcript_9836/m.12178 type:complete len:86 (+) Transcript_9836:747-1004(+)
MRSGLHKIAVIIGLRDLGQGVTVVYITSVFAYNIARFMGSCFKFISIKKYCDVFDTNCLGDFGGCPLRVDECGYYEWQANPAKKG